MSVNFGSKGTRRYKIGFVIGFNVLLVLALSIMLGSHTRSALAAGGAYSGVVFRDYNGNGVKDAREPGLGGITITMYDSNNVIQGTTTSFAFVCASAGVPDVSCKGVLSPTLGSWSIAAAGGTGPYRVEFTGLPSWAQEAPYSSAANGNHTSVQFVNNGGGTNINFAVNDPGQYTSSTNPTLATVRQITGTNSTYPNIASVVSFPYNSTGTADPTSEATVTQTGSLWGVAYSRSQNKIYVSAYEKRMVGFGSVANPQGEIYAITPGSGVASAFANIPNTGTNLHSNLICGGANDCDNTAFTRNNGSGAPFSPVGKASLGALVINDADNSLYTVNMSNTHLYSITVPGGVVGDVGQIPSPTCTNGVARPFGLGFNDGKLYMGGVCDASLTGGISTNLMAYVYEWNPATAFPASTRLVITFPLNYPRTCSDTGGYANPVPNCQTNNSGGANQGPLADWHPWTDAITTVVSTASGTAGDGTSYPMPMLTKIQFDNSDMIIGFRDRGGDMLAYGDPGPNNTSAFAPTLLGYDSAGDVLRANPITTTLSETWAVETNSQSSLTGIFGPTGNAATHLGQNSQEGPGLATCPRYHNSLAGDIGCGRFFYGDSGAVDGLGFSQLYLSEGGLLQVHGFSETVVNGSDPIGTYSNGAFQLSDVANNADGGTSVNAGDRVHGATSPTQYGRQLYCSHLPAPFGNCSATGTAISGSLGKANGLGDLVALFTPAPIELGNRVWNDVNGDGIQEPGEPALSGITVTLYQNGVLVGTTQTDANGQYIFSSTNVLSGSLAGVQASTLYQIRIPLTQTGLSGLVPTVALNDSSANGTLRDSNGVSTTNTSVATVTTGLPGANDHSIDFGFHPPMDFGDLPDTGPGNGPGNYDTLVYKNGPRHVLTGTLKLGACVTAEPDGQPNSTATGDACDDGVQRVGNTAWQPGVVVTLNVTVTGGTGALGAWFDWNNDGTFLDTGEFISRTNLISGSHLITLTIPAGYVTGTPVYARFRLFNPANIPGGSLTSNLYDGLAVDGEVEDYMWNFGPTAITLQAMTTSSGSGTLIVFALAVAAILGAAVLFTLSRRRRVA